MLSWQSPEWDAPENIIAYCTTREGGFSTGDYCGLNVGAHVGDNATVVEKNRAQLPYHQHIHWLNQVHGNNVLILPSTDVTADAAISRSTDAFCAVMTADCVPILLCNSEGTEVAAAHAGWKGLASGIIAATIENMESTPSSLFAWVGPSICGDHYEVPQPIVDSFSDYPEVVRPSVTADKYLLNLPAIAKQQLHNAGVSSVTMSNRCTYCESSTYYSHRYATHQGKEATGRFVSVIGLR